MAATNTLISDRKKTHYPMTVPEVPGMLERVRNAVRPLTESGNYRLERVEYMSYYGDLNVIVASQDIEIRIHILLKSPDRIVCFFREKSRDKSIDADYLFSAYNIDIPLRTQKPDTIHYERIRILCRRFQRINEVLLEKTKFIEDLSRLSSAIRTVVPKIEELLGPDHFEETWRLYVEEGKRKRRGG